MQFPIHTVYEFLCYHKVLQFHMKARCGQGVGRKEKKIDPQKENLNYTP